ncbi:MAG: ADP-ribosylglycohydrolase family protein [Bacteroidales bacterium]
MNRNCLLIVILLFVYFPKGFSVKNPDVRSERLTKKQLRDKVKGAWAGQVLGCTYGGPTEFRYVGTMIQDYIPIPWGKDEVKKWFDTAPGLYDDVYVDLTFVEVFDKYGLNATVDDFANAFKNSNYPLCHANQQARYNLIYGATGHEAGFWKNNPHADCLDFQIEADFAGIMSPGMPNVASAICDTVGHLMSYGNGWYGGVYVAGMYSLAFIYDNIEKVVEDALILIPQKSTFYQCIRDVINWYKKYPGDWKQTWFEVERKWSEDYACPDGVYVPFNIETPVNAAYIVIGLLYGQGDFERTLDISTRCGQDSDCNPASAGGILGTLLGYSHIPEKYRKELIPVEDTPFSHTPYSLNKAYEVSYKLALGEILLHGGEEQSETVTIRAVSPQPVQFEESFGGLKLLRKDSFYKSIKELPEMEFKGVGMVLKGMLQGDINQEYVGEVAVFMNDQLLEKVYLPIKWNNRKHEIFFKYDLPNADYKVRFEWLNPIEGSDIQVTDAIFYDVE